MPRHELTVAIERDLEGMYVATVPALAGCHTQARSLDELMQRIQEAALLCLEMTGEEMEPLELVGIRRITVPV